MFELSHLPISLAVTLHLAAVALAIVIGPFALYRSRRDRVHKALGYSWVMAMVSVSLTSFAIPAAVGPSLWGFGFIHLFSCVVLISVTQGVLAAVRKQVDAHRGAMTSLYWQALGIAGLFAFAPDRSLNRVLFGGSETAGFAAMSLGGLAIIWAIWPKRVVKAANRNPKAVN